MKKLLLLPTLFSILLFAATDNKSSVKANLKAIDENLSRSRENKLAAEKNLTTVQEELTDLQRLRGEHLGLKKRYEDYIEHAKKEITTNVEKHKHEKKPNEEYLTWKRDAETKLDKVAALYDSLLKNLRDIDARLGPLESQKGDWKARVTEYDKLIGELTSRREKIVNSTSN